MKGKESGRESESIRVIDEASEEVVRLGGSSKRVRVESKGRPTAELMDAKPSRLGDEVERVRSFDPEAGWVEGGSKEGDQGTPLGWFFLLGAVLLGVVIWATSQGFGPSLRSFTEGGVEVSRERGGSFGRVAALEEQNDAESRFKETEELVANFLGAKTIEERVKFVRHPERVRPLMEDYYSRNEFQSGVFRDVVYYRSVPIENRSFIVLEVNDDEGEKHTLLLEDGEEDTLVDWETYVCFQPVVIDEYIRERPTEPVSLRVRVVSDYFYSYEFDHKEEYLSFALKFNDSDLLLNGYVKRGTELGQRFRKLFPEGEAKRWHSLILKVRFLENGQAENSVLIEDLISTTWVYPGGPAEVASSEK